MNRKPSPCGDDTSCDSCKDIGGCPGLSKTRERSCMWPSHCIAAGRRGCAICEPPIVQHDPPEDADEVLDSMSEAGNSALADLLGLGSSKR